MAQLARTRERLGTVTIACLLLAATTNAQIDGERELIVRIYNSFGVPRQELATTQGVAETIFREAGIRIVWRECRTPSGPSAESRDECGEVLQPAEVIARIVTTPRVQGRRSSAFGYSLVDTETGVGMLSTVLADRITEVAARLRIHRASLMGRALAHEIGHLLLGTNAHTPDGLMRRDWPERLLRTGTERDWRFSAREGSQMATSLVARATPNPDMFGLLLPSVRRAEDGATR